MWDSPNTFNTSTANSLCQTNLGLSFTNDTLQETHDQHHRMHSTSLWEIASEWVWLVRYFGHMKEFDLTDKKMFNWYLYLDRDIENVLLETSHDIKTLHWWMTRRKIHYGLKEVLPLSDLRCPEDWSILDLYHSASNQDQSASNTSSL